MRPWVWSYGHAWKHFPMRESNRYSLPLPFLFAFTAFFIIPQEKWWVISISFKIFLLFILLGVFVLYVFFPSLLWLILPL